MGFAENNGTNGISAKSGLLVTPEQTQVFDIRETAVTITDRSGVILYVNRAFTSLTGYSPGEAIGNTPRILKSGRHDGFFYRNMWSRLLAGQVWHGEVINRKKDGSLYVNEMIITPAKDRDGLIDHFIAVRQDVTQQREAQEKRTRIEEEFALRGQIEALVRRAMTKEEVYKGALGCLLKLSELARESRGLVFEADPKRSVLVLKATSGMFSREFLRDEALIPYGRCLCGRAAVEQQVLVCEHCHTDPRHENKWLGMKSHGHYTIPLVSSKGLQGVINLYSDAGIHADQKRTGLLAEIGNALGEALLHL